mmetsp:Transcript_8857/g.8222  ORF Transcript_8857/g.8222 Transcript_8857/m.8222 type:complete len:193 (+) Transcript_8857:102-680(+)
MSQIQPLEGFKTLEEFTQKLIDLKTIAQADFENGKFREASSQFLEILDHFQEFITSFQESGLLLSTNILQIFREVHINLGLAQIKLQLFENAIDVFTALLHYFPQDSKALYLRGKSALVLKEYELAINDFRLAKIMDPHCASLLEVYIKEAEASILNEKIEQGEPLLKKGSMEIRDTRDQQVLYLQKSNLWS